MYDGKFAVVVLVALLHHRDAVDHFLKMTTDAALDMTPAFHVVDDDPRPLFGRTEMRDD